MIEPILPLFPVTTVGSLPRTATMKAALKQRRRKNITDEEFRKIGDAAVLESLQLQDDAGVDIVSDGEMRRDNFYSFIADVIDGIHLYTLADLLDFVDDKAAFERLLQTLDVPAFAIKNPVVNGKLVRRKSLAVDDFKFLQRHTSKPIKVALPGPYLLTRSMWVKSQSEVSYPTKESLGEDVCKVLREELNALRDAGCFFVQFDEPVLSEVAFAGPHATHTFMCAALGEKASPEHELNFAVELINEVVKGVDGIKTGLHVCRGNWSRQDSVLLSGSYEPLLPYFTRMQVKQLVLEYATDRAGSVELLKDLPDEFEIGLGVMNPRTTEIESAEFVATKVNGLLKHRPKESIYLNPDCGFGTFADRPVNTWKHSAKKLSALTIAAKSLRVSEAR